MFDLDRAKGKGLLLLVFALGGLLLFSACTSSPRAMARSNVNLWADALNPPPDAELLYRDTGVARPDSRGCWAVYIDRVYGTDDPTLAVMNHYDQSLKDMQGWIKNPIIVSDHSAVYDHPDGSSVEISTNIAYDFPSQSDKYQARYRTLFFVVITSRSPEVREGCREY
jgi:hypothetical protein